MTLVFRDSACDLRRGCSNGTQLPFSCSTSCVLESAGFMRDFVYQIGHPYGHILRAG